jgi:transcriptional regulator with XRE-family HTH domain
MDTSPAPPDGQRRQWPVRDAKALGRALRDFRVSNGFSQTQLAQAIGVDRSYISEMELGKETEQLRRLFAALKALDVRVFLQRSVK